MARMKRIVVPGYPHHIVQRGVRSMDVFFKEQDRIEYLNLLKEQSIRFGVTYISYCLMTNHIHLLAVPEKEDSLAKAVGEAHRRYTRMINFRDNVRGFLFQGRFSSCPVYTGEYLLASVRYIEQNPVKAKIVKYPWQYKWSSAGFHCKKVIHDPLIRESSLLSDINDWKRFLSTKTEKISQIEEKTRTGRPFGPDGFYSLVEELTGNNPRPGQPGRPRKKL
ncbi:MAG: transposase [Desulfobacteraceae bacterium]|nr:transposase [Desulfobacteraceae bacterium]